MGRSGAPGALAGDRLRCIDINLHDAIVIIMRTTLNIDGDVLDQARAISASMHISFRSVVNEALRAGLTVVSKRESPAPHQTKARSMGLKPGYDLDNIADVLARLDGEDAR